MRSMYWQYLHRTDPQTFRLSICLNVWLSHIINRFESHSFSFSLSLSLLQSQSSSRSAPLEYTTLPHSLNLNSVFRIPLNIWRALAGTSVRLSVRLSRLSAHAMNEARHSVECDVCAVITNEWNSLESCGNNNNKHTYTIYTNSYAILWQSHQALDYSASHAYSDDALQVVTIEFVVNIFA